MLPVQMSVSAYFFYFSQSFRFGFFSVGGQLHKEDESLPA
jgi:hypothetical protein